MYVYQQLHYHFTFWSIIRIINLFFHSPRVHRHHIQAQHSSPLLKQRVSCSTVGAPPSNLISSNQGRPLYQHLVLSRLGVLKLGITVFICFAKYPPPHPTHTYKRSAWHRRVILLSVMRQGLSRLCQNLRLRGSLSTIAVSQDYSID